MDRLNEEPGVTKLNIKPQVDFYTFPTVMASSFSPRDGW